MIDKKITVENIDFSRFRHVQKDSYIYNISPIKGEPGLFLLTHPDFGAPEEKTGPELEMDGFKPVLNVNNVNLEQISYISEPISQVKSDSRKKLEEKKWLGGSSIKD